MIYALVIVFASLALYSGVSIATLIRYNKMIKESHEHDSYPHPDLIEQCASLEARIYVLIGILVVLAVIFLIIAGLK